MSYYQEKCKAANAKGWNWPAKKRDLRGKKVQLMTNHHNRGGGVLKAGDVLQVSIANNSTVTISGPHGAHIRFFHGNLPDMKVLD